jgi:N-acetylglucosamine kinase-like BadF-type ATPase
MLGDMMGKFFFGIDGGGTRSRIAIVDGAGKILAREEGGSTNIYSVSPEEVRENLGALLEKGLAAASLEKSALAAGCIGSAGLRGPGERALFRGFFDGLLEPGLPVKFCTDGEILLVGGLGGAEGYCLISGTGSIALGRSRDGRLVRAGGLGYLLGDEGSAAWIGRTAAARVLRGLEGRDMESALLPALLSAAGLGEAADLVRYVHRDAGKAAVAALAPVVTAAARNGDPLARDILHTGAAELALLVKSVRAQSPWIGVRELVLAGGALEHDEVLTGKLRELLAAEAPELRIRSPERSALEGACILARAPEAPLMGRARFESPAH